jgi:hypothetical protein
MRLRIAMLAAGCCALVALSGSAVADAAPSAANGLTIAASPNQILAGQSMLIYGQLQGPDNAGQRIILYHRVAAQPSFTIVQRTRTNAQGYYEFVRPDGIVVTNRSWYVVGPGGTHSNTVSEQVSALVSLSTTTATTTTGQQIAFSGTVFPYVHNNQEILLQEQNGLTGTGWKTIATTYTNNHSSFSLSKAWRTPNDYTLRAVIKRDAFNVRSFSDSLTESVEQTENPSFTVNSSSPIVPEGQSTTISGLFEKASTSAPEPNTQVTLFGKQSGGTFEALATGVTSSTGGYSFAQTPVHNTVYYVAATLTPKVRSAVLFEGVQDELTINPSGTTATVGSSITVTGTITPDKTGHEVTLQELGTDGHWHDLQYGTVTTGSAYSFTVTFGQAGTTQLRARILGGPDNIGNASASVSVSVSGVAPVASLPAA